jgi:hypothetical protein
MPDFHFDPIAHIYALDGVQIPSLTGILKAEGYIDTTFYTEDGAENGSRRHYIFHLDDIDDLLEDSIDESDIPYLEAWRQFKRDVGFQLIESETPTFQPVYGYGCTPDKRAMVNGKLSIVEVKTGKLMPWTAIQAAGQALCFTEYHERIGVAVSATGYKIHPFRDRHDKDVWLACLTGYKWKQNNIRR